MAQKWQNPTATAARPKTKSEDLYEDDRVPDHHQHDGAVRFMQEHDIPLTLENYLLVAYMGDVTSIDQLSPEQQAEIPRFLRG